MISHYLSFWLPVDVQISKLCMKITCSYENIGVNHLGGSDQPK